MLLGIGKPFLLAVGVVIPLIAVSCGGEAPSPAPPPTPVILPPTPSAATPTPAPVVAPVPTPTVAIARPPTPAATPERERPRYGGIIRKRIAADAEVWDGHWRSGAPERRVLPTMFNGVLMRDVVTGATIVGDLATRWEISPDGLTYTFHFPRGVKWHDGTPFTSSDVAFSYRRIIDKNFSGFVSHIQARAPWAGTRQVGWRPKSSKATALEQVIGGHRLFYPSHHAPTGGKS